MIFLVVTLLASRAAVAAAPLGPLGDAVAQTAALPAHGLIIIDAEHGGTLRWAAWGARQAGRSTTRLALRDAGAGRAKALWSAAWADAYEPELRLVPQWTYVGRPLLALTMRFGAAARQINLYGIDAGNYPVPVVENLGAEIGWTIAPTGGRFFIVYTTPIVPTFFAWEAASATVVSEPCS